MYKIWAKASIVVWHAWNGVRLGSFQLSINLGKEFWGPFTSYYCKTPRIEHAIDTRRDTVYFVHICII